MKLDEIYRPIHTELDRVERFLETVLEKIVADGEAEKTDVRRETKYDIFTSKAINYLLTKPGKNLRPALVLFSARSVGIEISESLIRMAGALELIHSASLVHDDIIDEAEKRRGLLSVHKKYGVKMAILIGDVLFAQSFAEVAGLSDVNNDIKVRLYEILTDLTRRMCYGEIFEQKILDTKEVVEPEIYFRVLEFKTALLMSAACRCGAILGGANEAEESALASFGLNYGYAYQLVDDIRDDDSIYSGDLDKMETALKYVKAAGVNLEKLPESEIVSSMLDFVEFVVSGNQNDDKKE